MQSGNINLNPTFFHKVLFTNRIKIFHDFAKKNPPPKKKKNPLQNEKSLKITKKT